MDSRTGKIIFAELNFSCNKVYTMKFTSLLISFIFLFTASQNLLASSQIPTCNYDFNGLKPCTTEKIGPGFSVELKIVPDAISRKRKNLSKLIVRRDGTTHQLVITPDTTLMKRDQGYISFTDINFDGIADLAITTSFGVANLYLDYWVYMPKEKQYKKIGNYSVFELGPKNKTLSNTTKINAATYETVKYKWDAYKLVRVSKK